MNLPQSSRALLTEEEFLQAKEEYKAYSQRFGSGLVLVPAPPVPEAPRSKPRTINPEAVATRAKALASEYVEDAKGAKARGSDWATGGRPVSMENYSPEWQALISLYGNMELLASDIGCSAATIWKWNKGISRPSVQLTKAVRVLAKHKGLKSPL